MAFDLSTAKPSSSGGFDISTAKPFIDENSVSSSVYESEVLEPSRQRAINAMPSEEVSRRSMSGTMVTNPISAIKEMFRKETPEEKEFNKNAETFRRIKDREAAEFSELYPEGMDLKELFSSTPEGAGIGERGGILLRNLLISDDAERAKSLKDIGYKADEVAGQWIVEREEDGQRFIVNKPNLSQSDLITFSSQMAQSAPFGKYVSGARGAASVFKRALAAGLAEGVSQELAQKAVGGEFNWADAAITTVMGPAGEGVGRYIGNRLKSLSPELKRKAAQSDNLIELMEVTGVDEKKMKDLLSESATSIPEKNKIIAQIDQGLSLAKLEAATKSRPSMALDVEETVDMANAGHIAALRHALDPQTAGNRSTLVNVRNSIRKLNEKRLNRVYGLSSRKYDEAFEGIDSIDVTNLRKALSDIAEMTNPSSPEGSQIDTFIRQLSPKKDSAVVLDAKGREILDLKKDPRLVQNVVKSMRRIMNSSKDANVVAEVRKAFDEVFPELNARTGGKLALADKRYAQFMEAKDSFIKSHFGVGANVSDLTWGDFQEALFNPKKTQKFASDKFMKDLAAENPDAARKLWGNYWNGKLANLPSNPKPSDLRKAIFGGTNHPADYAPNPISKRAIYDLEKLVKANEAIEGITLNKAAKQWADGKMDPEVAHWVYVRMGISRALKGKRDRDLAAAWFGVATDPNFAKQLVELVESPEIKAVGKQINAKKRLELANTYTEKVRSLFSKWMADNNIGTGGISYSAAQATPQSVENQVEQQAPNE